MSDFDVVLRQGLIHDGSGSSPWVGDIAVRGDRIVAMDTAILGGGRAETDMSGLAVAPGFINMMSWSPESLIADGRSLSNIMQGVTLEVMGEGTSMGPLNDEMKLAPEQGGIHGGTGFHHLVEWTTLGEYLTWLEARGVSTNITSFVGAGTLRIHEVGFADRPATESELARMCELLDEEMRLGAVGVASALIYPPETSYSTAELVALARVSAAHGGLYASHIRSEGEGLLTAIGELIEIARLSGVRAECYHLKACGESHWPNLDAAIAMIEAARAEGLRVTADMYPYEYAGTSLAACIPPWAHADGPDALRARLADPTTREQIRADLSKGGWENMYLDAGPANIMVRGPLLPEYQDCAGRFLAEIAEARGVSAADMMMDLCRDHPSEIFALYFDISPAGVRRVAALPWVSFCTDAESLSRESALEHGSVHPRAFGAFARVLGPLVRDEGLFPLADAIRRMTSLPADNLGIADRGRLRPGHLADIVAFDPDTVTDRATPDEPARYADGMAHVWVNGVPVLRDGVHTEATPGRFVRGPGARLR